MYRSKLEKNAPHANIKIVMHPNYAKPFRGEN
jgi:hypothetical protein